MIPCRKILTKRAYIGRQKLGAVVKMDYTSLVFNLCKEPWVGQRQADGKAKCFVFWSFDLFRKIKRRWKFG